MTVEISVGCSAPLLCRRVPENQLENTGIAYEMVLGRPHPRCETILERVASRSSDIAGSRAVPFVLAGSFSPLPLFKVHFRMADNPGAISRGVADRDAKCDHFCG